MIAEMTEIEMERALQAAEHVGDALTGIMWILFVLAGVFLWHVMTKD